MKVNSPSAAPKRLGELIKNLSWARFWFEPQSPLPISVFRIIYGAIMMIGLLVVFRRDYLVFFGTNAVFPTATIDVHQWHNAPVFDLLLLLPADDGVRIGFLYFSGFMAFLVMIGFATRFSTIVLFFCYLSLCNHFPLVLMGGDNFARLICLFLCFAPCGERVSVDALLRKNNEHRKFAPWAQRMIQVQLCIIYLVNVLYKMAGVQWRDGSAVYYATRLLDYTRVSIPEFLDVPVVSRVLTWLTLALESLFVFVFWIVNKRIRYAMLLLAVVFHLGLDYTFSLGVFEWYFIASLILFVDAEDLERMLNAIKKICMIPEIPTGRELV